MADYSEDLFLFRETRYSGKGIASTVLGALSLVFFVVLTALTVTGTVKSAPWIGALGLTAFAASLVGVVLGLKSFSDPCRSFLFCKLGTVLCGLLVAVWFLIFCVGLSG